MEFAALLPQDAARGVGFVSSPCSQLLLQQGARAWKVRLREAYVLSLEGVDGGGGKDRLDMPGPRHAAGTPWYWILGSFF